MTIQIIWEKKVIVFLLLWLQKIKPETRDFALCRTTKLPRPTQECGDPGVFPGSAERLLGIGYWDFYKPLTLRQSRFLGLPKKGFLETFAIRVIGNFVSQKKCVSFGLLYEKTVFFHPLRSRNSNEIQFWMGSHKRYEKQKKTSSGIFWGGNGFSWP